ncbi:septation protein SepH [Alteromonas gracilis]
MTNTNAASRPRDDRSVRVPDTAGSSADTGRIELTPVGLGADGGTLVLVDDRGSEYSVALGARLGEVISRGVRGEQQRPEPPEEPSSPTPGPTTTAQPADRTQQTKGRRVESALRPRDIQHRIRGGEDPESVAEVAGLPVERIMNYAAPVLAERAHVAGSAAKASVRRKSGEPSSHARTLEAATAERMSQVGLDPETAIEWDAWRRPDGRWALVADYTHEGAERRAAFVFDVPGKFVLADNDEARWLVGDGRFPTSSRTEQSEIGEDAIAMVRSRSEAPGADSADADWMSAVDSGPATTQRPPRPVQAVPSPAVQEEPPAAAPSPAADEAEPELPFEEPGRDEAADSPTADEPAAPQDAATDESEEEPAKPQRPSKNKRGRASVPSWDEIMFGGGPKE